MSKRGFHFAAISKAVFTHEEGSDSSTAQECSVRLETSPNLDKSKYISPEGYVTQEGLKVCTLSLVMGLSANVALGVKEGWWSKEEHVEYIKLQLDKLTDKNNHQNIGPGIMEY